ERELAPITVAGSQAESAPLTKSFRRVRPARRGGAGRFRKGTGMAGPGLGGSAGQRTRRRGNEKSACSFCPLAVRRSCAAGPGARIAHEWTRAQKGFDQRLGAVTR